uniref:Uncharacterized protein n=1 Tax=Anguilla anguilla TaxID=7936 RepID=A0A0E9RHK8_ANGAN
MGIGEKQHESPINGATKRIAERTQLSLPRLRKVTANCFDNESSLRSGHADHGDTRRKPPLDRAKIVSLKFWFCFICIYPRLHWMS